MNEWRSVFGQLHSAAALFLLPRRCGLQIVSGHIGNEENEPLAPASFAETEIRLCSPPVVIQYHTKTKHVSPTINYD
jgi:hypothetical protein